MYDASKQIDFKTLLKNELAYDLKNGKAGIVPIAIGEVDLDVYEAVILDSAKMQEMVKIHFQSIFECLQELKYDINPPVIIKVSSLAQLEMVQTLVPAEHASRVVVVTQLFETAFREEDQGQ